MKYQNIDELDARIERIVKKTVESYYTDWKNYDRPKYMGLKGSSDRHDKKLVLIARRCGTYLLRTADIKPESWSKTLFEYYMKSEDYYEINLDRLTIVKIDPEQYMKEIKKAA